MASIKLAEESSTMNDYGQTLKAASENPRKKSSGKSSNDRNDSSNTEPTEQIIYSKEIEVITADTDETQTGVSFEDASEIDVRVKRSTKDQISINTNLGPTYHLLQPYTGVAQGDSNISKTPQKFSSSPNSNSLKKAVPEHISHDHNLARHPERTQASNHGESSSDSEIPTNKQTYVACSSTDGERRIIIDMEDSQGHASANQQEDEESLEVVWNDEIDEIETTTSGASYQHQFNQIVASIINTDAGISLTGGKNPGETISVNVNGVSVEIGRFIFSNSLCRVCLLHKERLLSIWEDVNLLPNGANPRGKNGGTHYNILVALEILLDMKIKVNDGLPSLLCIDCLDNIMSFSAFRERIALGQNRLDDVLKQVKYSSQPTMIPPLGEEDIAKIGIYRSTGSIIQAKKILSSPHSHLVVRRIPDKIWEKIFSSMKRMLGFKSARLKELEHYAMESPFVKGWFCTTCNLTVHGPLETYTRHWEEFHEGTIIRYPCDICGSTFSKISSLPDEEEYGVHWLQHFFLHECDICERKMPNMKSLWSHKRSAHSKRNDINAIAGPKSKQCETCGKKFRKKSQLDAHKLTHLEPDEQDKKKLNTCPYCHKSLSSSLKQHIANVHSDDRPWKCEICPKHFKKKNAMLIHLKSVHASNRSNNNTTATKFQCEECGIYLKSLVGKKAHQQRHKMVKPYKCDLCPRSFFTITALRSHQISHKAVADIPCKLCDKTFKRETSLTEHMRIHLNEKPYECQICKRKIRIRSNYYKHLKIHQKHGSLMINEAPQ